MNYISNEISYKNTLDPENAAYFSKRKRKNKDYYTTQKNAKLKNTNKKVVAFYASWDDESLKSLKANYSSINIVIPDWYNLNGKLEVGSNIQPEVDKFIKGKGIDEMPLINNYVNSKWDSSIVHSMVDVKNKKKLLIKS